MNSIPKPLGPGRPKDLEKRQAVLDAAQELFLTQGFTATSMDSVAQAAGVSKLTVYSHFGDKEGLFRAAIETHCDANLPHVAFEFAADRDLRTQLLGIARGFRTLIFSDKALALHRVLIAEAQPDTDLARAFYASGPCRTIEEFASFLRAATTAGRLDVGDATAAAGQFFAMLKGESHFCRLIGLPSTIDADTIDALVAGVVDMFLRAYAPR